VGNDFKSANQPPGLPISGDATGDRSKIRTGRPPRLKHRDEWELFCYRRSGMSIKQCASFFRVSVPTGSTHEQPIPSEWPEWVFERLA
jgi:hypothetical protein